MLPKLNLSHSQPELFDRKATIKDSAKEEQNKRASFLTQNRQLNKHLSEKDPLVTIPDQRIEILDMVPKLDIIEDQTFRKSIPKSTKLYKFSRNFDDKTKVSKNSSLKFMRVVVKNAHLETLDRDIRFATNRAKAPRE